MIEIGGKTYDQWSARERMQELDAEHPGRAFPDDVTEEWNALAKYLGEIERRREVIAELAKNPANREDPPEWAERAGITPRQTRDDALRTLDRYRSSDELSAEACDRVTRSSAAPTPSWASTPATSRRPETRPTGAPSASCSSTATWRR